MRPAREESGQATVELVALAPALVGFALLVLTFLAGHSAREAADQAAVAGAMAQLQGGDAVQAARAASPGWAHSRVGVADGRITVVIAPKLPRLLARAIDAEQTVSFDGEIRP